MTEPVDVAVVGGGHNALVAATYLARAGLRTVVLERSAAVGGAAVSVAPFAGVDARLSRYSYLVSLLPERLVTDLGLRIELRSRATSSYTPTVHDGVPRGLLVQRDGGGGTRESFRALTGDDREHDAWERFYAEVAQVAGVVAPTLLEPLPSAHEIRARTDPALWQQLVDEPLGATIESRFHHDVVRGVVATDALIGTFASLHDPTRVQNRCFLYHLIGNGTGEWRVPVGGMGAVTTELARVAREAGADLRTNAEVTSIEAHDGGAHVHGDGVDVACDWVLGGLAPYELARLLGDPLPRKPSGSQLKINLLVRRLPQLRSGADPATAFAGTLHLGESLAELERAHAEAASGVLPAHQPGEMYCHTLTDPSILGPDLAVSGAHTLTYFGLHTPAELFADDNDAVRDSAVARALAELDAHLEEPVEDLLLRDADGRPCLEAKSPLDIERALAMPGGHIFHGDLAWPWRDPAGTDADLDLDDPATRWGVATSRPRVLLCGSGARRGGAVSGIAGHNAAHAVLEHGGT